MVGIKLYNIGKFADAKERFQMACKLRKDFKDAEVWKVKAEESIKPLLKELEAIFNKSK